MQHRWVTSKGRASHTLPQKHHLEAGLRWSMKQTEGGEKAGEPCFAVAGHLVPTVTLDNFKGKLTACWADNYREMDWKCQNTHVYSSLLPVFTKDCKKETSSGKNVPVSRRYWNERDSRMTLMSPHKVEREEHGGTEGRKEGWLESDIVMPLIFFHVANGSAWKQTAIFIVLLKQSCSQRNSGSTLKEPTTVKQLPSSPTHPNREEAM